MSGPVLAEADDLIDAERRIMDGLAQSYGSTDWSAVVAQLAAEPGDTGNPNVMVIPISLANVYLQRYEMGLDEADFDRAFFYLEWTAENYWMWGQRWLTPAVAQYLAVSVLRLRGHPTSGVRRERIESLWAQAASILEQEADARLGADLPYRNSPGVGGPDPFDSSATGDTRAEENAWEAVVLAAAANFLADHPHAAEWDRKARQLAYDAITRPSDPPDAFGVKTTTVPEDLALANHAKFPNPYYMAATLFLLRQGALCYRLTGRPVPEEFEHNAIGLFARYRSLVDASLKWTVSSDPEGDATLFPLGFDSEFDAALVLQKAADGYLWKPVGVVGWVGFGVGLWEAIQNSKVVLYYLMGSYLWSLQPLLLFPPLEVDESLGAPQRGSPPDLPKATSFFTRFVSR
jgi:hypothetical protein